LDTRQQHKKCMCSSRVCRHNLQLKHHKQRRRAPSRRCIICPGFPRRNRRIWTVDRRPAALRSSRTSRSLRTCTTASLHNYTHMSDTPSHTTTDLWGIRSLMADTLITSTSHSNTTAGDLHPTLHITTMIPHPPRCSGGNTDHRPSRTPISTVLIRTTGRGLRGRLLLTDHELLRRSHRATSITQKRAVSSLANNSRVPLTPILCHTKGYTTPTTSQSALEHNNRM
jgi:hypothetical protein